MKLKTTLRRWLEVDATQPTHDAQLAQVADQERITAALVGQAQAEVAGILSNADSHDNKALALLALDGASIALLIGNHGELNRFWFWPIAGFLISGSLFLGTIWPRSFPVGPALRPFYAQFIGARPLDVNVALLDALTQAIDIARTRVDRKARLWPYGLGVMLLTALAGGVSLAVVR